SRGDTRGAQGRSRRRRRTVLRYRTVRVDEIQSSALRYHATSRMKSISTEHQGPSTPGGRSGSFASRVWNFLIRDGLTAKTASESRKRESSSKMWVTSGLK